MECIAEGDSSRWNLFAMLTMSITPLKEIKLREKDLRGWYLANIDFEKADLRDTSFCYAYLNGSIFDGADLRGTDFTQASLSGIDFKNTKLEDVVFKEAIITYTDFTGLYLEKVSFDNADCSRSSFFSAHLKEVDFRGAKLFETNFKNASLSKNCFKGANFKGANLNGADLSLSNLSDASFVKTSLLATIFNGANLFQADLKGALLSQADLRNADISGANLYDSNRDGWLIDGIKCDYVYWDKESKEESPQGRMFDPGEFEDLYKKLPELKYYFSNEFTPITPIIMDSVVNNINKEHSNIQLRLDSFHSRGNPHAVFTVQNKDNVDIALKEITDKYEKAYLKIDSKIEMLKEAVLEAIERPQLIQHIGTLVKNEGTIEHMENKFGNIISGRDSYVNTGDGKLEITNVEFSVSKSDIDSLEYALVKLNITQEELNKLKSAVEADHGAPEHKNQLFGKYVDQWFNNMKKKAGSTAWRLAEGTTASTAAGMLVNALKAYYGWK